MHLASLYSREDTTKMLLARKADPTTLGGPKAQGANSIEKILASDLA